MCVPLILNPWAAKPHLTIIILPLNLTLLIPLPVSYFSIRLLNTILTPVINNRQVIPLSINIPLSLLWVSEALQFLSPLQVWFTPFLAVCPGLFSPHRFLSSVNLRCVSFSPPLLCLHVNLRNTSVLLLPAHIPHKHPISHLFLCRISRNSLEITVKLLLQLRIARAYLIAS